MKSAQPDMVAKPTNAQKYMKVYYKHSIPPRGWPHEWPKHVGGIASLA